MNNRILRRCLCAFLTCFSIALAQAHDFVTERAWVEDPSGGMTLAEVKGQPATPLYSHIFTQGFSHSTYWLRLRIDPKMPPEHQAIDKLIIRIRPPYQDQVWLYDPLAEQDTARVSGDFYNWAADEYQSLNLNFVIPLGHQPRDVWLKLRTNQSTLTVVEVMSENEARATDRRQEMATMLYFAVLFICFGWAVLTWINKRDALVSRYIVREILAIAYALAMLGYYRVFSSSWLPDGWLDPLTNLTVYAFISIVIWFDSRLIGEFKPNRLLARLFLGLAFVFPIEIALVLTGHTAEAVQLNALIIMLGIVLALACAASTRAWSESKHAPPEAQPVYPKIFLVGVYGLVALLVLLNRLPVMGVFVGQESFFYFSLIYPLLTSVLMMGLVQIRIHRLARRHEASHRRLQLAEFEAEKERAQRIEQSNFLKMLAHEMKTPLSVVRMATSSEHRSVQLNQMVDRAVADMNGIIERLLEVERLNDQQIVLQPASFCLRALIDQLVRSTAEPGRMRVQGPTTALLCADQRFVQVVLSNLIDNALKYGAADQPVCIDLHVGTALVITIANAVGAAGAPDPVQVFQKYYRAPGAHEKIGSGLGLYLTRSLVDLLGGHIRLSANPATVMFVLELPLGSCK